MTFHIMDMSICCIKKSRAINMFEVFINDVERELDKKVKIERSNRDREYDGTYDETGQTVVHLLNSWMLAYMLNA